MKGKLHDKDGNLVVMYKHYSPGRDNYGHERYSWKTTFYKISNITLDMFNYIGTTVNFKRVYFPQSGDGFAEVDLQEIKRLGRDIKINKIINEKKRIEDTGTII